MAAQYLRTDVLVAGAGPAGSTVARLLALGGRRVVLVDPLCWPLKRLEILAPALYPVLDALNLRGILEEPSLACHCLGIRRRWGTREVQIDDFLSHPGGRGLVIERSLFDKALLQEASNAGTQFIKGRVTGLRKEGRTILLNIQQGKSSSVVHAHLIVDATGRPSALARRLGARRIFSERLVAERFASTNPQPKKAKAVWLEVAAEKTGWSYSVSGPDGRGECWRIHRIGDRTADSYLKRVDASSVCLSPAGGEGWIAVGDAVASFDPITSQGLFNALSTSLVTARVILSSGESESEKFDAYSAAVAATFAYSEVGRKEIYQSFV